MSQYGNAETLGEGSSTAPYSADPAPDPTYYDVLKCEGEFATPSLFFLRSPTPARVQSAFPWPAPGSRGTSGGSAVDNKHRLRRSTAQSGAGGTAYQP
ncbi:hypothetical protein H4R19_002555, partial [Coemansia spiralis]